MLETVLLGTKEATATIAVKNLGAAKKFYEGTLGLTPIDSREPTVVSYHTGTTKLFVYESPHGGTNQATSVTWVVGEDIESIVHALKSKGVTFEHYDMPNMKLEGDLHVSGNMKAAWFKDPDGNILAVVNG
jgi:catechol 2,3-dioxygenase-like lactoylglutathione lyase family enzyme